MTVEKKRVSTVLAGVVVAGALMFSGAGPAQAAGGQYSSGPYSTLSACETAKRAYNTAWTKISQGCTYYPKQGGFTASGYYFHYRTVG